MEKNQNIFKLRDKISDVKTANLFVRGRFLNGRVIDRYILEFEIDYHEWVTLQMMVRDDETFPYKMDINLITHNGKTIYIDLNIADKDSDIISQGKDHFKETFTNYLNDERYFENEEYIRRGTDLPMTLFIQSDIASNIPSDKFAAKEIIGKLDKVIKEYLNDDFTTSIYLVNQTSIDHDTRNNIYTDAGEQINYPILITSSFKPSINCKNVNTALSIIIEGKAKETYNILKGTDLFNRLNELFVDEVYQYQKRIEGVICNASNNC